MKQSEVEKKLWKIFKKYTYEGAEASHDCMWGSNYGFVINDIMKVLTPTKVSEEQKGEK
jgi:hypothetical protein